MSKIEKKKVTDFNKVPDGNLSRYIAFGVDRVTNESAWADMESLRGNTAFQEWQDKNPGKTYDDWIALLQEPAKNAADGIEILKKDLTEFGDTAKASENARVEAEKKRVEVEGSRVQAENERASAESLRKEAEELRDTAETDRNTAEEVRIETETNRIQAEGQRITEETKRIEAENLRNRSEQDRVTEENKRIEAENTRIATEILRDQSEQKRDEAENLRNQAESVRASEEVDRNTTEQERIKKETERIEAENLRISQEEKRSERENDRIVEEQLRRNAENARKEAETGREIAEEEREKNTTQAILDSEEATEKAKEATEVALDLNAHPMKIMGGIWFEWSVADQEYKNTGIQAKGDVGASFRIIGRYDTLDELIEAVPDGTNVDGVYAIGAVEPFDYYAWLAIDGVWQWDNQGKLRGAEGKSSYEVWEELPENEGKTLNEYFDYLSPLIDPETGRWIIQGEDTKVQAVGINAEVTEKENTEDRYVLHIKSASGEYDTPNIRGISVKVEETENTPDRYLLTFTHAKGTFTTPNLRGFDVKVREAEENTPDDYRLEITTVKGTIRTPNLKGRSGSAVIDLDHEPTETDTHYTYNGVQYAFSVGDETRWYDKDAEEYVLFKLYAVTEAGAVWEEMGSGSGSPMTDVILTGPSDLSSDESESYIYLENGYLKGKEE